jgi:acetate kinase
MNILVLNVGSSSLKFQLIDTDEKSIAESRDRRLARGQVERIGGEAIITLSAGDGPSTKTSEQIHDHAAAVEYIIAWLTRPESKVPISRVADIEAVGHRVVHGGERFTHSTLVDDEVWRGVEELIELAPLHNPHNLRGIAAARAVLGAGVPQVAVFDTAFHHSLPDTAYLYAIPYQFYRRYGVRRYGFHGTSHRYIAYRYRQLTGRSREATKIITLHLGNGASACAIVGGASVDTSMGFTPLEGLVMGTRSGDLDPAILEYIAVKEGMILRDVDAMLNKQSGDVGARRPPCSTRRRGVLLSRQEVHRRVPRGDERRRRHHLCRWNRREFTRDPVANLRRARLVRHSDRRLEESGRARHGGADRHRRLARRALGDPDR